MCVCVRVCEGELCVCVCVRELSLSVCAERKEREGERRGGKRDACVCVGWGGGGGERQTGHSGSGVLEVVMYANSISDAHRVPWCNSMNHYKKNEKK